MPFGFEGKQLSVGERVDRVLINQSDKIKICESQVIFSEHQANIVCSRYSQRCAKLNHIKFTILHVADSTETIQN